MHTFLRNLAPLLLPGSSQQEKEPTWNGAVGKSLCILSMFELAALLSHCAGEAAPLGLEQ